MTSRWELVFTLGQKRERERDSHFDTNKKRIFILFWFWTTWITFRSDYETLSASEQHCWQRYMVQEWCHPRGINIYMGRLADVWHAESYVKGSHGLRKKRKGKRVADHFSRASTTRMKKRRKDIFTAAERRRLRLACALPMYLRKKQQHTTHALSLALSSLGPPVYEYTFEISIYVSFLLLRLKVFFFASPPPHCVVLFCSWSEGDVNE